MQRHLTKLAALLIGIAIGAFPAGHASAEQSRPSNTTVGAADNPSGDKA